MDKNVILNLAVKAMSYTMWPEGLVLSYLIFGFIPRFTSTESTLSMQQQSTDAMQFSLRDMAIFTAQPRIPRNTDLVIEVSELGRVFGQTNKLCVGPYPAIRIDRTNVYILQKHREVKFNKHQVLPAPTYDNIISGGHRVTTLPSSLPSLLSTVLTNLLPLTTKGFPAS